VLRNIQVASKPELGSLPRVKSEVLQVEEQLGSEGRLVLRYSGTEPLARVMIEGRDQKQIEELAERLAITIAREIERLQETP
jgi:phosphoglucosamine mutase